MTELHGNAAVVSDGAFVERWRPKLQYRSFGLVWRSPETGEVIDSAAVSDSRKLAAESAKAEAEWVRQVERLIASRFNVLRREFPGESGADLERRCQAEIAAHDLPYLDTYGLGYDKLVLHLHCPMARAIPNVPREQYERLASVAREHGGSWGSPRRGGTISGFHFGAQEAAEAFRTAVGGRRPTAGDGGGKDDIVSEQEAAYGPGADIEAIAEEIAAAVERAGNGDIPAGREHTTGGYRAVGGGRALVGREGVAGAVAQAAAGTQGWDKPSLLVGPAGVSSIPGDRPLRRRIDFTRRQVAGAGDLAALWTAYRHPRMEIFHAVYVDAEGRILAHNAMTLRLPSEAPATERRADWEKLVRHRMKRLGATGYYLVHSHPGGDPTPSLDDRRVVRHYGDGVPGLRGFLVLDHDRYVVGSVDPKTQHLEEDVRFLDQPGESYVGETAKCPRLTPGTSEDVARAVLAGETHTALVWVDSQGRCVAWDPVSAEPLHPQEVHRRARAYGAMRAVVLTESSIAFKAWEARRAQDETAPLGHVAAVGLLKRHFDAAGRWYELEEWRATEPQAPHGGGGFVAARRARDAAHTGRRPWGCTKGQGGGGAAGRGPGVGDVDEAMRPAPDGRRRRRRG